MGAAEGDFKGKYTLQVEGMGGVTPFIIPGIAFPKPE
jgi:hypothetical protein